MKPRHILLVEDNEGDILLTTEALESAAIACDISVVTDGKKAIDFLNKTGDYSGQHTPDLILLDINLPRMNGQEVLQYVKTSTLLKHIPVIILTTSCSEKDINQSYNNFANCYITKPVDVGEFMKAIAKLEDFWISIVQLPTNSTY